MNRRSFGAACLAGGLVVLFPESASAINPLPPGPFPTPKPTVTIAAGSYAPYNDWLNGSVIPTIRDWYPFMAQQLSDPSTGHRGYRETSAIQVKVDISTPYYAYAAGSLIVFSDEYAWGNPNDMGGVIHEATHVLQAYPGGMPGWITEGLADWTREYLYGDRAPVKPTPAQHWTDGYSVASYFLNWVRVTYDWWFIHDLNVKMHNGTYTDRYFKNRTGYTIQQLWDQMLAS